MRDFDLIVFSVIITFIGILANFFLPASTKSRFTAVFVIVNSVLTSIPAIHAIEGSSVEFSINYLSVFGNISIKIDSLSAWFILIINLTSINGILYGIGYMKSYEEKNSALSLHWILYLIFHSSMLWVCMVQHGFVFLIAWELMSLSSLLLVIFDHRDNNVLKAGVNYLIQMHISVVFLTVAFIWVYFSQGSFGFDSIGNFFSTQPNILLFFLFFVGFGIKAGFIPLHSWLPHAHPAAPSHISGVMSGVIVKLGIYGILRIISYLKVDFVLIGEIILSISVISGIYGILNSALRFDLKKMLAYCTIENIGIIGIGIGLGLIGVGSNNNLLIILGFSGALLHTLNHSLFKSLLFFSAGSIYQQTHTRNIEKLGGLIKKMPQTAILFLVGALAIGGLPPFNGFVSEFLLYKGFLEGIKSADLIQLTLMIMSLAGLALIGGLSILTFTKNFGTIFLGVQRSKLQHEPHEVSLIMRIPQYLIIGLIFSIAFSPGFYFTTAINIVNSSLVLATSKDITPYISTINTISGIGRFSFVFLILITLLYLARLLFTKSLSTSYNATWGCGYIAPNSKMEYTGKSFSKTLGKLLGFVVTERKKYNEIIGNEIFPVKRIHTSYYIDFFEENIIKPFIKRLMHSMNYFQFIQNGKIQSYVLYGIFFVILIFLITVFKFI